MKFLKELLTESGPLSMLRFMSLLALVAGIVIAIYGMAKGTDLSDITELAGMFVAAAFTGKVAQKFAEKKSTNPRKPK